MIIAFDLDGTLADLTHRLYFITGVEKDWEGFFAACAKDAPIASMIQLAGQLAIYNTIEIWSGRSDVVRPQTERWLKRHLGNWGSVLRMRKAGDHRPDDEVKGEWFDALKPDERPAIAFEDRQRVVDMWRSRGVICCQVAPGDF